MDTAYRLKPLHRDAIPAALEKVERYRLLNEPMAAESICLDVLAVDPDNQQALVALLLARTDQFDRRGAPLEQAQEILLRLKDEYARVYYEGILCERYAKAELSRDAPGSGFSAHEWFQRALACYERAEAIRPPGNDSAILRWNTCVRILMRHPHVKPRPVDRFEPMLE
jgi:hypothetical protein